MVKDLKNSKKQSVKSADENTKPDAKTKSKKVSDVKAKIIKKKEKNDK